MTITIEDDPREARLRELERVVIEAALVLHRGEEPIAASMLMFRGACDALLAARAESSTPTATTS
jgi:hypothetical protein